MKWMAFNSTQSALDFSGIQSSFSLSAQPRNAAQAPISCVCVCVCVFACRRSSSPEQHQIRTALHAPNTLQHMHHSTAQYSTPAQQPKPTLCSATRTPRSLPRPLELVSFSLLLHPSLSLSLSVPFLSSFLPPYLLATEKALFSPSLPLRIHPVQFLCHPSIAATTPRLPIFPNPPLPRNRVHGRIRTYGSSDPANLIPSIPLFNPLAPSSVIQWPR